MAPAIPCSLSEGAAERSEAEGVYFDERNRSKISEPIKTVRKPSARWNHRTTLPQSALAGCQLPQRGSRERLSPSIRLLAKILRYGRFSSPLRNSDEFGFYRSMGGTRVYPKLSFSPWETLWHRSRKVSWLMVATEEGSCTGPVAMVPFSPGRVPPAREAAHRSRAYRAA